MGLMELVAIVIAALSVAVIHIFVHVLSRSSDKHILAFYGVPVLFLIASSVTPPDLISTLMLAMPLSLVYSVATVIWIATRRARMNRTQAMPEEGA